MANLIDYHIPEAIQIRVTKSSIPLPPVKSIIEQQLIEFGETSTKIDNANENICTFCIDPQLTSLSILQTLIVRGFNLQWYFHKSILNLFTLLYKLLFFTIVIFHSFIWIEQ